MTNNLRMGHKLWLAVLAIIVLLVSVVGFAGYRSSKSQAQADAVTRELATRVESALKWQGLTETNAARTQAMIVSSDPAVEGEFKEVIAATSAQISQVQKALEAMNLTEADKAQMAKIAAARSAMLELRKQATQMKGEGRNDEAIALVKQSYNPAVAAYLQSLRDFVDLQQKYAAQRQSELGSDRMRTVQLAGVMVALVLAGIGLGAYFLIRSIQQPLAQAQTLAQRIAAGDLSSQEAVVRGDEFGDLLRALNSMSESLGRMVYQVRQSTDSIATASSEIAQGNHDLSARTEQTSSNLQETAAAMEQFTSTIQQSAQSAQQASSLANGAASVARKGGDVVSQVVSTMEEIQRSSSKIADIIGVIDGIAFQTNILALNAAVEAARAGEQGRGFAVVASEVRSLAGRSAEAAKEIKQLIGVSVEKVEAGSGLVQQAGSTMQDIVQSVQRVTDMIGEITAASTEQSAGIAQVNQAVGNLDQMTQQNAALVEESTAAAQSLREQAEQLAQAVSQFKVSGAAADAMAAPRRHAPAPTPASAPAKPVAAPAARPLQGKAAAAPASTPRLAAARPSSPPAGKAASAAPARPAARANEDDWESF